MAGLNHSKLMAGQVVENPQKEQDEEDLAILSSDSESEVSDADDYVPQVQSADDLDQGSSNLDHSCRV